MRHHASAVLMLALFAIGVPRAQDRLVPFHDRASKTWGYKHPDGRVAIAPRYDGAGAFRGGRAPVKDSEGFAIIDPKGQIVERIATDSVAAAIRPIPPPADACAGSPSSESFSKGLDCYVKQLRGSAAIVGGRITISPASGEGSHSAVILKLRSGVVVVEDIGYEGFLKRVLLPGVSEQQAREWRRKLYPDVVDTDGCSESWNSGAVSGGAFIEQAAGC